MSRTDEIEEAYRWLATAREDYRAANLLFTGRSYPHSCFFSQQTGEKAIKALGFYLGNEPWGHSIQKLIADVQSRFHADDLEALVRAAIILDKYYITSRYPDSVPDFSPGEIFLEEDAERAIEQARLLLEFAERIIKA